MRCTPHKQAGSAGFLVGQLLVISWRSSWVLADIVHTARQDKACIGTLYWQGMCGLTFEMQNPLYPAHLDARGDAESPALAQPLASIINDLKRPQTQYAAA